IELRSIGVDAIAQDLAARDKPASLAGCAGAILAASVHLGKHEREMIAFVKKHRAELERMPTAFLSVSGSECRVELETAPPAVRAQAAAEVREVLDKLERDTGWHPTVMLPVAGAMLYSHYNPFVRWMIRRIVRRSGAGIDTTQDHEYTDWNRL